MRHGRNGHDANADIVRRHACDLAGAQKHLPVGQHVIAGVVEGCRLARRRTGRVNQAPGTVIGVRALEVQAESFGCGLVVVLPREWQLLEPSSRNVVGQVDIRQACGVVRGALPQSDNLVPEEATLQRVDLISR